MTNWDGTTPFEGCAAGAGAACGAMSTSFDGAWSLAPRTSLGADGKSIVLSGFADGGSGRGRGGRAEFPPAAVRFAWRAYPCEVLGCGVYTVVGGVPLPPAPFHSAVEVSTKLALALPFRARSRRVALAMRAVYDPTMLVIERPQVRSSKTYCPANA